MPAPKRTEDPFAFPFSKKWLAKKQQIKPRHQKLVQISQTIYQDTRRLDLDINSQKSTPEKVREWMKRLTGLQTRFSQCHHFANDLFERFNFRKSGTAGSHNLLAVNLHETGFYLNLINKQLVVRSEAHDLGKKK
ncbi:MAG: hypothetical protein V1777_01080 [Candidatus Micrarchaeota archaeon]